MDGPRAQKEVPMVLREGWSRVDVSRLRMVLLVMSVALMVVGCDGGGDGY